MTMTIASGEGTVILTDAVLSQIVVQAAESVDGVRVRKRRGVTLDVADTGTHVAVELTVAYGRVLPELAHAVQERVTDALVTMCGADVTGVDVAVEELD